MVTPLKCFLSVNQVSKQQEFAQLHTNAYLSELKKVKPGIHLGEIGRAIGAHAIMKNCAVVRDYCGHGIGLGFHEMPQVIHYDDGKVSQSPILEQGMTFTIEPMINLGGYEVITSKLDGWDSYHQRTAPFQHNGKHTILVTENGYEILTLRKEELIS